MLIFVIMIRLLLCALYLIVALRGIGQPCHHREITPPLQQIEANYFDFITANRPISVQAIPIVIHLVSDLSYEPDIIQSTILSINSMLSDNPSCEMTYEAPPNIQLCLAQQDICGNASQGIYDYLSLIHI